MYWMPILGLVRPWRRRWPSLLARQWGLQLLRLHPRRSQPQPSALRHPCPDPFPKHAPLPPLCPLGVARRRCAVPLHCRIPPSQLPRPPRAVPRCPPAPAPAIPRQLVMTAGRSVQCASVCWRSPSSLLIARSLHAPAPTPSMPTVGPALWPIHPRGTLPLVLCAGILSARLPSALPPIPLPALQRRHPHLERVQPPPMPNL